MTAEAVAPRLRLSVQFAARGKGLPARSTVRHWLLRALRQDAMLTVRFVDEAEGRQLNHAFRGRNYATNVLTFSYGAGTGVPASVHSPPELSGDIALCVPVLRREAHDQQKSLRAHCAHLTIHGALHLQGHDHESPKDAKVMETL
ncbi:MAG: rRNA maturation RNase YbeY, partial [Betaproteobacteria bacterium]